MNRENRQYGKVVLVGAGPGDPDLITVKGLHALRQADVIIYDYLAGESLLSCCKPEAEKIYVGKKSGQHTLPQDEINQLLIDKAQSNRLVVRLKGGDPFIFGRGGEEVSALAAKHIEFEIVPGITSGIAALTYAGIPATYRGDATSVSFITGHEDPTKAKSNLNWKAIANLEGTLVFYMGVRNLPLIVRNLLEQGKSPETPVALIRWGTLPYQLTLTGTLEDIDQKAKQAHFAPPALIVVGDVVRYRQQLNWFEQKPLFGKRIVITRSRAQSSDLLGQLSALGADVIEFPTIRIEPPQSWEPLDEAIENVSRYDWVVFTSVNGVESFHQRLAAKNFDLRKLSGVQVAAIGPATAQRLAEFGIRADLQPDKFVAEALMESLKQCTDITGERFLLARAEEARSLLRDELLKAGAMVDEVIAYRTVLESDHQQDVIERLQSGEIDLVTFTSSSTVKNFMSLVGRNNGKLLSEVPVACIGPITKQTAEQHHLNIQIMPDEYTIPGLVQSIVNYYQ